MITMEALAVYGTESTANDAVLGPIAPSEADFIA